MPAPKSSALTYLHELRTFASNLKDVKYEMLLSAAADAGWDYRLVQSDVQTQPDSSTLVTYDVLVGRTDSDAPYQFFDKITMHLLSSIGPVSLAGRLQAMTSLIYLFFGRLPPAAPAEQTIDVGDHPAGEDIKLPGEDPLPADEPEQEYVPRRELKMPNLVDHVEPDGVPVYIDLDSVPEHFDASAIIDALLEDMDRAAVRFDSKEQVLALYSKNTEAVEFLKELGTDADKTRLKDLLDRHAQRIEANAETREVRIPGGKGTAAPRRRRAA